MARAHNIVIVGAGIFGSLAARLARAEGHKVTVVDCLRPWAASKASGCVLAPSWLSSLSKEQLERAMDTLRMLVTVHDVHFKTNLAATFKAQRVNLKDILVKPDLLLEVTEVDDGVVRTTSGPLKGKVLVAAGIESARLVPAMPPIRALWGASALFRAQLKEPRLHVYAPYRQAVAFQLRPDTVWMGDGTALVTKTWEKESSERVKATVERGVKLFKLKGAAVTTHVGARPYVEGHKAGYFDRVLPNTWVSTGGAKNGTALAAYQAYLFLEALK